MKQKIGFIWFNATGPCDGSQTPWRQVWWRDVPFHMESLNTFVGADPIPEAQRMDLNVQLAHSDGNMIHIVWADRYQYSSGIADVSQVKYFQTPWIFNPGDALIVTPYGLGPQIQDWRPRWGICIQVEGYIE